MVNPPKKRSKIIGYFADIYSQLLLYTTDTSLPPLNTDIIDLTESAMR